MREPTSGRSDACSTSAHGHRAFEGESPPRLIGAILKEEPAPPSTSSPRVPAALDRIVATCLAKDPDDRWQSARDLARELQWIRNAPPVAEGTRSRSDARSGVSLVWMVATLAIAAFTGLAVWWFSRAAPTSDRVLHAVLPVTLDAFD